MSAVGEANADILSTREGQASTIGDEVKAGMAAEIADWLKRQGKLDPYKARMQMWQTFHTAFPEGKLKEWHGNIMWLADLDAHASKWSGQAKDFIWKIAKGVIASEFPPALLIPDHAPSTFDALQSQLSGEMGKAAITGSFKAYEAVKSGFSGAKRSIDQIMASIVSGGAMTQSKQGGLV